MNPGNPVPPSMNPGNPVPHSMNPGNAPTLTSRRFNKKGKSSKPRPPVARAPKSKGVRMWVISVLEVIRDLEGIELSGVLVLGGPCVIHKLPEFHTRSTSWSAVIHYRGASDTLPWRESRQKDFVIHYLGENHDRKTSDLDVDFESEEKRSQVLEAISKHFVIATSTTGVTKIVIRSDTLPWRESRQKDFGSRCGL
ncbi:hypothetical protein BJ508DRAFT_309520 [Ascobolus immersus RN42]|uniref:Uncharacterized protein n=1 Tax=Ascobolus immersus RN42 TaxID=1160509 RepID=A0A3N4HYJ3_ASCIM|nr:hypothetical protein BJ508DRAFT_309520 [Ascobolus immersus RN42]